MILKKTLLIEKKGDYMKRLYKTRPFWNGVPEYEYQYWSRYDSDYYYWEERKEYVYYDMMDIIILCDGN